MIDHSIDKPATPTADIPPEAWNKVTIEAAETLDLFGKQNRGFLEVTLANNSDKLLEAGSAGALALSFKVLDADGQALPVDAVRTPLATDIPAGARHTQKIAVIIPSEKFSGVASVRVGLVKEGQYWVEQLNPAHGVTVQVTSRQDMPSAQARLEAASQIWPQRQGNGLRWPYGPMMVSERHKLFYIPVAKCACTSLKSMMVRLAAVAQAEIAMELGVHLVTDRFNTGVQLKDKPIDRAREILASADYFKFSVIRDPFERLVSAYLEKFVYKRHSERNLLHTRSVIGAVQGTADIDLQRGISFDEFLEYILQHDPFDLDAHWRPQHLYFRGVPHISRIFRLENISELEAYLLRHHRVKVKLGHENSTAKSDLALPEAPTLPAGEFDQLAAIDPDSFLRSQHVQAIRQYYREDFEFYAGAS
ncbi:sulfotransferase family protein [Pseudomonadota bacterium]